MVIRRVPAAMVTPVEFSVAVTDPDTGTTMRLR